jgi:MATE family multidrug resistance protein
MTLGRDLFRLSLPMVIGQLAFASMSFIDTVLMGQLGVEVLAGGGLAAVAFQFFYVVGTGVLVATANLIAYAKGSIDRGAGELGDIHRALLSGVVVVFLLTFLFGVIIWNISPLLLALGQDPLIVAIAERYLHVLVWALFPALFFILMRSFVLGIGRPQVILPISIISAALNYPISYVLMTGQFGLPAMGVEGVALGTCIVSVGMALAIVVMSYRKPVFKQFPFWRGWHLFSLAQLIETLRLGVPIALAYAMEIGMFSAAAILIGLVGVEALAAHQVALQCTTIAFMVPLGFSQAVSVKVGEFFGAGKVDQVKRTVRMSMLTVTVTAISSGSAFLLIPETLTELFLNSDSSGVDQLLPIAVSLLFVAALFQMVDAYQVVLMGVLRGFRLGASPTIAATISYWLIGFPISYWLHESHGAVGVWVGMGLGLACSAMILATLYLHFSRTKLCVTVT